MRVAAAVTTASESSSGGGVTSSSSSSSAAVAAGAQTTTITTTTRTPTTTNFDVSNNSNNINPDNDNNDDNNILLETLKSPLQGDADWREFRCLRIKSNGIIVVLVNDKTSKTTGFACTVGVGCSADPRSMSGLAHFVEHAVFMGSMKYPLENEYKSYLSKHGGRCNASTSMHMTTYQGEIIATTSNNNNNIAEHAIDIFSQFFISPLFERSSICREVLAVDSENSKNLISDGRRRFQISKDLMDKNNVEYSRHPYTKFSTGNHRTLLPTSTELELDRLRYAMMTLHKIHYRPNNMYVVIIGPQSLDTLQSWTIPKFALIHNNHHHQNNNNNNQLIGEKEQEQQEQEEPKSVAAANESTINYKEIEDMVYESSKDVSKIFKYEDRIRTDDVETQTLLKAPSVFPYKELKSKHIHWPIVYVVKPIRSMRKLTLQFPLPTVFHHNHPHFDRIATRALSHLLGHEGKYSSFAILQNAGYLSSLSAGIDVNEPTFSIFEISINLTELGEQRWPYVIDVIFQHCALLHREAKKEQQQQQQNDGDGIVIGELGRIWDECARLEKISFHQTSPNPSAYNVAHALSQSVARYGTEHCLSVGKMLHETTTTLPIKELVDFCSRLIPSNCIIERCSEMAWDEMIQLEQRQQQQEKEKKGEEEMETTTTNNKNNDKEEEKEQEKKSDHDSSSSDEKLLLLSYYKDVQRRTEPWYGVDYFVCNLDEQHVIGRWETSFTSTSTKRKEHHRPFVAVTDQLRLPTPNRYIPRSLQLCDDLPDDIKNGITGPQIEKEIIPPKLLLLTSSTGSSNSNSCNSSSCRLWHRLDDRYSLPKSVLTLLIRNPAIDNVLKEECNSSNNFSNNNNDTSCWIHDVSASIHSNILVGIFNDSMAQETYDSHLAGLHWNLALTASGIKLTCSGYSDRLSDLALTILKSFLYIQGRTSTSISKDDDDNKIVDFITDTYFIASKDRLLRNLRTYFQSRRSDSYAVYYRDFLLASVGNGINASITAAENVTLESIMKHHTNIIKQCCYHHGSSNNNNKGNDDDGGGASATGDSDNNNNNDGQLAIDCLYTGNVSEKEARSFFQDATKLIHESAAKANLAQMKLSDTTSAASAAADNNGATVGPGGWIPRSLIERRLNTAEDIELHFPSQNPQEENGSVMITYQSPIPGYRGRIRKQLSSAVDDDDDNDDEYESTLKHAASIRLLCQMLREPLYDELRTKQTLGYIVSSYHDVGFSTTVETSTTTANDEANGMSSLVQQQQYPVSVPVDYIVINVLSRQLPPLEVRDRMDTFLKQFRYDMLANEQVMSDNEIEQHATALSTKLLKPILKLNNEASTHFTKINRYASEVIAKTTMTQTKTTITNNQQLQKQQQQQVHIDLPWDNAPALANTIKSLKRDDLITTWDRIMDPKQCSRIVTCVYGTTYPLNVDNVKSGPLTSSTTASSSSSTTTGSGSTSMFSFLPFFSKPQKKKKQIIVNNLEEIIRLRQTLPVFDSKSAKELGLRTDGGGSGSSRGDGIFGSVRRVSFATVSNAAERISSSLTNGNRTTTGTLTTAIAVVGIAAAAAAAGFSIWNNNRSTTKQR